MDVYEKIKELNIIPVVTINNGEHAIPLGKAIFE